MKKIKIGDTLFVTLSRIFAWSMLALSLLLVYEVVSASGLSIKTFGWQFAFNSQWDAVQEIFGALPYIYGTIFSSLIALLIAIPLSLGIAIYLSDLAPHWIRQPLNFLIELLAAIPSIIYGLWGVFVMVPFLRNWVEPFFAKYFGFLPFFQGPMYGIGMMAAGVILSIMIIPTISSVSREVLSTTPTVLKEAALAIGATRWEMVKMVLLPYGRSGILGAVILGLGRALGETMAVTMVIGNRPDISLSLFAPSYTMASVLANEFAEAVSKLHVSSLMEIAMILLIVTLLLNIVARSLVWSVSYRNKEAKA